MESKFSDKITEIISLSRKEATRTACKFVAPEHLLLAMFKLEGGMTNNILRTLNTDIAKIKATLEEQVKVNYTTNEPVTGELAFSPLASNILRLAVLEARLDGVQEVEEHHMLEAMLHDAAKNGVREVLEENNVSYADLKNMLSKKENTSNNARYTDDDDEFEDEFEEVGTNGGSMRNAQPATGTSTKKSTKTPVLDNFGVDLTRWAAEGKLDPVVGRDKEIIRVLEILGRRKKNNPILIGEPGVGKSAIVEGLAQMIADKKSSPVLYGKRLVSLDMTGMVAGTKYRGQFEERMRQLLKELESNNNIILFIDEIHTMIGAGGAPGTMDAANILKPALARGTIQCIGATTLDEYRNSVEKDGALERRFQKVIVEQTTPEQTLQILHNIKGRYEDHHHVEYSGAAIMACVKMTERYVTDRQFPDKAIDALDEAGSKVFISNAQMPPEIQKAEEELNAVIEKKNSAVSNQNFELAASYRDRQTKLEKELQTMKDDWNGGSLKRLSVTDDDVANVVSQMSGIPVQRIAEDEGAKLRNMAEELNKSVVAQEKAIEKISKAILRNRVGLRDPGHPIGVFMFLGPTGVGKTYLAKKLAELMFGSADNLIRIDMSEYTESFTTSRLTGAPPGYVGYEQGGQLTEKVRRKPYSIVLLDEIEKAHGNVFNMLLQVLDEGRLTDGNGRLVDFRNTVIIMTSNAGTRQLKDFSNGVGFNAARMGIVADEKDKEYARGIIQKALSKQFAPEFLNRLDEIITFDQLDLEAIKKIVDIELRRLIKRVEQIGYKLEVTDDARTFVAEKGYDVQFGARPLKRAIQSYIEDHLSELIVNGNLQPGQTITVDRADIDNEYKNEPQTENSNI